MKIERRIEIVDGQVVTVTGDQKVPAGNGIRNVVIQKRIALQEANIAIVEAVIGRKKDIKPDRQIVTWLLVGRELVQGKGVGKAIENAIPAGGITESAMQCEDHMTQHGLERERQRELEAAEAENLELMAVSMNDQAGDGAEMTVEPAKDVTVVQVEGAMTVESVVPRKALARPVATTKDRDVCRW